MSQDIKDIRPPIDIPSDWFWILKPLAVVFFLVLLAGLIIWFFKRPRKTKSVDLPVVTAWERAYKRLDNLQIKNLINRTYLKPFYTDLSDILRRYLEERFSIKAPEMTTEEFLDSLRTSPVLNDIQKGTLREFLFICDMVKFAQHESDATEAQKCFDLVKQLVDQTHGV